MLTNICIIPARGGSKRIPRKNIKVFLGQPIIAYSIQVALQSGLFDEVMVSTDDEEIAEIAKSNGAQVPFLRSTNNANDFASTVDVITEVIETYEKVLDKQFKFCCCIYPTAPFITTDNLIEGFSKLRSENLDSVFPVVEFSYPIWRSLKRKENRTIMNWPQYLTSRSQDLEKAYHDAGQWYWLNLENFQGKLWTDCTDSIILPETSVQDIDTISDWAVAEMKFELNRKINE